MTPNLTRNSAGFCYHFVCLISGRDPYDQSTHEPTGGLVLSSMLGVPGMGLGSRPSECVSPPVGFCILVRHITPGQPGPKRDFGVMP